MVKTKTGEMIIANDKEMVVAGLFECIPCDELLAIWCLDTDIMKKEKTWQPIMGVFKERQEDSTHTFAIGEDTFFISLFTDKGCPEYAFKKYIERKGNIKLEEIEK